MNLIENHIAVLQDRIERLPDPHPAFNIEVGWAKDYDGVFSGQYELVDKAVSLLDHALKSGRVLLTGRGGGAKSVILTRVAKAAVQKKMVCVFITLKEWTIADYGHWRDREGAMNRMTYLLQRFSGVNFMPRDISVLDPSSPRIIIVDGLNEVDAQTGQQIVYALDEYARFALKTSVLVSDRLVRRDFIRPERWQLSVALPLSPTEVRDQVSMYPEAFKKYESATLDELALLTTPYFLNAFISGGALAHTTSDEMREYFQRHALAPEEVDKVAEAAYLLYADSTRTFEWKRFTDMVGTDIAERLIAAGAISLVNGLAFFDHHLKHDFLVARHLAKRPRLWTSQVFSAITFHASSFETIRMAMEQIETEDAADELLRHLYDWNIYGAGYSIAEGRASRVSDDMQIIILAMFAERRWDRLILTAQRANDTLRMMRVDRAEGFLAASSLEELFALLAHIECTTQRFTAWRQLFTLPVGRPATSSEITSLTSSDSVIGWTAANVLKRLICSAEHQARLRALLDNPDNTVQWRAAHVLGSFPGTENSQSLSALLGSPAVEIRFGVVRSLLEMASRSSYELSETIFRDLSKNVDQVRQHPSVLSELERALFVRRDLAPPSWTRLAFIIISTLQRTSPDAEDRERWDQTLIRMMDTYGS